MLDQNDLAQIRLVIESVVSPVEGRLDSKIDALNRKLDSRIDEVLAVINEYATVTDRRLARLEAFHA